MDSVFLGKTEIENAWMLVNALFFFIWGTLPEQKFQPNFAILLIKKMGSFVVR